MHRIVVRAGGLRTPVRRQYNFGEAVAAAAAVCHKDSLMPRQAAEREHIGKVHALLHEIDHTIFGAPYRNREDLARSARISASSTLASPCVERVDGKWPLRQDGCFLFPVVTDRLHSLEFLVEATADTRLRYTVMSGRPKLSTTPYEALTEGTVEVTRGERQSVQIPCDLAIERKGWHFLVIHANPALSLYYGNHAPVGLKAMYRHTPENLENAACVQITANRDWDYLLDPWEEASYCLKIEPAQPVYLPENVAGEWARPTFLPNLWISQQTDFSQPEYLDLEWDETCSVKEVQLIYDSSIENFLAVFQGDTNCKWGGYEHNVIPSVVRDYRILYRETAGAEWIVAAVINGNYQRMRRHVVCIPAAVAIRIEILATNGLERAQVYAVRVLR